MPAAKGVYRQTGTWIALRDLHTVAEVEDWKRHLREKGHYETAALAADLDDALDILCDGDWRRYFAVHADANGNVELAKLVRRRKPIVDEWKTTCEQLRAAA